jgi:DNA-binding CsgD family transcriptional regulator
MVAVIIADIVESRGLDDRRAAQRDLDDALEIIAAVGPHAQHPLVPTVGDELQGVYSDLTGALGATLLLQLALPEGIELRFGVGIGEIIDIPSAHGPLSEGEGWWAARRAIDEVEDLARRSAPTARTRVAADSSSWDQLVRVANAGLFARDRAVAQLSARGRRILFARSQGRTQTQIAAEEGIGQSAVSQAIATADGGALLEGLRELSE